MTGTTTTPPAGAPDAAETLRLAGAVQAQRAAIQALDDELARVTERRRTLPDELAATLDEQARAALRQERHDLDEAAETIPLRRQQACEVLRAAFGDYLRAVGQQAQAQVAGATAELLRITGQLGPLYRQHGEQMTRHHLWEQMAARSEGLERELHADRLPAEEVPTLVDRRFPLVGLPDAAGQP